jgi:hypothetical protein
MQATVNPIMETYSRLAKTYDDDLNQKMTLQKVIGVGGCVLRDCLYEFLPTSEKPAIVK